MKGAVVLLSALAVLYGANALSCDYDSLLETYLASETELYCFNGFEVVINQDAIKCSETASFAPNRPDDMEVLCNTGFTTVGYMNYPCDTDTGELAPLIENNDLLESYSKCVADADIATLCLNVQNPAGVSQLVVDPAYFVENVDLVTVVDDTTDYYVMACDTGFDFHDDVTDLLYGYCNETADNVNTMTFHADSVTDGCYAMCPTNPTTLEDTPENFSRANIVAAAKAGSTTSASVECVSGFALQHDAADTYDFVCDATLATDSAAANSGTYSCTNCPKCIATCPANPALDQFSNADQVSNLASVVLATATASQATVSVAVTCESGFDLAEGASATYQVMCNSNVNDTASDGSLMFVGDMPSCKPMCDSDNHVDIDNTQMIVISANAIYGAEITGTVVCSNGFALEYGNEDAFKFVCGDGEATALGGSFSCSGDCAECKPVCNIPEDDAEFLYSLADGEDIAAFNREVPAGAAHIEISCKNDTFNLVGPRFFGCMDGDLSHGHDVEPFCADTEICAPPTVANGMSHPQANFQIGGGSHRVVCNPAYWFDVVTAKKYGSIELESSFFDIEVKCDGTPAPEFTCYFGCLAPDFQNGVTYPDMKESGGAPFGNAEKVTFSCNSGPMEGEAEATCDAGNIASPICGACSFSVSILALLLAAFALL